MVHGVLLHTRQLVPCKTGRAFFTWKRQEATNAGRGSVGIILLLLLTLCSALSMVDRSYAKMVIASMAWMKKYATMTAATK